MRLSIVIVSYNVRAFLEKCLISVFQATGGLEAEVFVVDNHSADDSAAFVRKTFPDVTLIENDENLGFAKANNIALRRAKGEYALILNPDTVLNEDTLTKCVSFMDAHPEAGAVGVRMLDGTGRFLPESKRGLPSPLSAFFKVTGLNGLFPRSNFFNRYYLGGLDPDKTQEVEVLTGAFMCVRTDVMRKVGYFDEDYFMYGEDIDLCFRIIRAGAKIYYLPDTSIIHYKGESTRHSTLEYVRTFYKAMLTFVGKHYSGPRGILLSNLIRAGIVARAILSGLKRILQRLLYPAIDALAAIAVLLGTERIWAAWYFNAPDHFDTNFYAVSVPLYVMIWLGALGLFGAYDSGRNTGRVAGGVLFGTLVIVVIYSLLPEALRSSRALIFLSSAVLLIVLSLITVVVNRIQKKRSARRIAVVGSAEESHRIMELLNRVDAAVELAGWISVRNDMHTSPDHIGHLQALEDLASAYKINEVIFSSKDLPFGVISKWMARLGPEVRFKIASGDSPVIVGSDSKRVAGEMYTSEIAFAIAHPLHARNKRMLDLITAGLNLLAGAVLISGKRGRKRIRQALAVIRGECTYVGYDLRDPYLNELPPLRPGIRVPGRSMQKVNMPGKEVHMINYLYAREYRVWRDLDIVMRSRP